MSTVAKREAEVREFPLERLTRISRGSSESSTLFNRELSLLEFHRRVLEEALDETNPLLERLKFVAIFAANIDEFFMIRVSGLKEAFDENVTKLSPDGMTPEQQLREVRQRLLPMIETQMQCLMGDIIPQLSHSGISIVSYDGLTAHEKNSLRKY